MWKLPTVVLIGLSCFMASSMSGTAQVATKSVSVGGNDRDLVNEGLRLFEAGDYAGSARAYRKAAERGSADGMVGLATLEGNNDYGMMNTDEAVRLYRTAIARGSCCAAAVNLGRMFYYGTGVATDQGQAKSLWEVAVRQRVSHGYSALGHYYADRKKWVEAISLFRKGAAGGDPDGYYELGILAHNGNGMRPDRALAMSYFRKAVETAHDRNDALVRGEAQDSLDRMEAGE